MSKPEKTGKKKKKSFLTIYIASSIVVAIVVAVVFPNFAMGLHVGGEIFLRLLKMMVVPLVVTSVMTGIINLGDVRKLGKPGGFTLLYYFCTTIIAVVIGLVVMNVIQPGVGIEDQSALAELATRGQITAASAGPANVGTILNNLLLMLFTDNLFKEASKGNLLPLIVFSIIFAGMLTTMGRRVQRLKILIGQVNDALMAFIMLLMNVAPIGIFCLVASQFGKAVAEGNFWANLGQIGWFFIAVLVGLGVHACFVLLVAYRVFTKKNPFTFVSDMSQAILTAFSTSSSSATLPVTMECAITKAGVSKESTEFVLPLGATVNMDGTALYEAGAAIFIAQVIGMDLSLVQQLTIAVTATLAAIGAAGIPQAGLVTMIIVLNAVGLPVEYIGILLPVDWLLDRFRTAVNVLGDSVGAAVIDQSMMDLKRDQLDEEAL